MAWPTIPTHIITLLHVHRLLLATRMSELEKKIYFLAHPSGPSNVTQDSSVKVILKKPIFMYILAQF